MQLNQKEVKNVVQQKQNPYYKQVYIGNNKMKTLEQCKIKI